MDEMPYLILHEDLFVWGMSLLILALLGLRFAFLRRQTQSKEDDIRQQKHDT